MRIGILSGFVVLAVLWTMCAQKSQDVSAQKKLNVLFIAVDDLRPELSCYGSDHMHTPNFDRLAARSTLFERAYCQQAVCAPSRNSLLTGLRPDALGIYDLYTFFRDKRPDVVTLPQHFKDNGYHTERMGKIYHTAHGNQDDTLSWSVPGWRMGAEVSKLEKVQRGDTVGLERDYPTIAGLKLPFYCSDAPEEQMSDAMVAHHAVERLHQLKDSAFFLAVGFVKPHLPFVAPKKYWDLYDPAKIQVPNRSEPLGMSPYALANFGELRKYHGIPSEGHLDEHTSRNLIHGYYAAVSMIDAQIGKLLDALDETNLTENTIIVLWGDHGWKLGEYGNWCKHSNMELDTRAPLFISSPTTKMGSETKSLAEFVDIYPTLCDLTGLEKPAHLEGQSLLPILKDPNTQVNEIAISQYPRGHSLDYDRKREIMGYSMRTEKYRYTRWQKYEDPSEVVSRELYNFSNQILEISNLADEPASQEVVDKMDRLLTGELAKYSLLRPDSKNVD